MNTFERLQDQYDNLSQHTGFYDDKHIAYSDLKYLSNQAYEVRYEDNEEYTAPTIVIQNRTNDDEYYEIDCKNKTLKQLEEKIEFYLRGNAV